MNNKGFTLVELLAVVLILGILVAFIVPKIISIDKTAEAISAKSAITELNVLELQSWTTQKLNGNQINDETIIVDVVSSISNSCSFDHYSLTGGKLTCGDSSFDLERIPSTNNSPGKWK
jgi:prepilin-type N-terminal cleavage/methylation domain-containing protein